MFEPNERFKTCFHTGSERTQHAFPTLGIIMTDRVFIRTTSFQRLKRNFLFSFAVLLTNIDHLLIMFHGTTKPPTVSYLMVLQVLTINLVALNPISQELSFGIKFIMFPVWIYSGKPPFVIEAPPILEAYSRLVNKKDVLEAQGLVLCSRFFGVLQSRSFFQH